MPTHQQIADHFAGELHEVIQVARYTDASLGLPAGVDVFIPDCHVLRPEDAALYPRSAFRQPEALEAFLRSLHRLQQAQGDGVVRVWHLGDMVDEWRSTEAGDAGARIGGICAAFPTIFNLLSFSAPRGLEAEILAGNHDFRLFDLPEWEKARFRIVGDAAEGQMMVLHGDVFDWLESLPDALQAMVVRLARGYAGNTFDLRFTQDAAVRGVNAGISPTADVPVAREAAPLAAPFDVAVNDHDAENVVDATHTKTKFWKEARALAQELNTSHGFNIRLMVIGHTHFARIARGTLDDGGPFVLMDCGAWLDRCLLPGMHDDDHPVLCAQFGVRIDDEVRLYQVGRTPANA